MSLDWVEKGKAVMDLIMGTHKFPCSVCGELLVWSEGFFKCPDCDSAPRRRAG